VFHLAIPIWDIALRSLVIFAAFVVVLRVAGKRELGQFTLTDLVLILLVANAVQPAMTGPDSSLLGGLVIIVTLFVANVVLSLIRVRWTPLRRFLQGQPALLARDGQWIPAAMRREGIDMEDAMAALREHGVKEVTDTDLVMLEDDGTISVVPKEGGGLSRGRRRVRYVRRGG
jgi:uncharacterized membrane protein YcaP (DUF421 family)